MNYSVRLIPEDDGGYWVVVPGLPGCISQGDSREEAIKNIKEAIELYLEVAEEMAAEGEATTVKVERRVA